MGAAPAADPRCKLSRTEPTVSPHGEVDSVLRTPPPRFSEAAALELARETFSVDAVAARNLGSERDQAFLLSGPDGNPAAVVKVSNTAEDPATLDMESLAALHVGRVDPTLPVAVPRPVPGAESQQPESYRAPFSDPAGAHWVRCYDVMPGRGRADAATFDDFAVAAWGETTARVGRALRSFFHPKAQRTMLWDVQHTLRCRPMVGDIADPQMRRAVEQVLDRFEHVVAPAWPRLRAQVVHSDLTVDNVLVDELGLVSGIVDFGDMCYSALAIDVVAVLDSLSDGREFPEPFRAARLMLDGYQRITPLEPEELRLMGEMWAARCAVTIAISSWRSAQGLEDAEFSQRYNHVSFATIDTFLGMGWDRVAAELGAPGPTVTDVSLVDRRDAAMGPALEPLSYQPPLHLVAANGVWMSDADGRAYLDAYNNVPCVGHSHPRVTEAIARQSRTLNTNLRYLNEGAVELAERLVATCGGRLDTVLFVNSGSEANDLAWRLATQFTGNTGGLCTSFAYHGVSDAIVALSPESWPGGRQPDHIEVWAPPDTYRGTNVGTGGFVSALERLRARGVAPAVTILDGVLTSDGFFDLDPTYVQELVRLTREAGGLWVADEVQGGHARTGDAMWSYQRFGIEPDFVTLGKPMGNGHPVAAVITRRDIAERFAEETSFFSTFGGNPVSVAAALAVLGVLEDERVLSRVASAGRALRAAVSELQERYPRIGDVRGMGLANGIELVTDPDTRTPDTELASAVKEGMRHAGVLVGTTGPNGNVLKVRPPLAFTDAHVHAFASALDETLGRLVSND